MKTAKTLVSEHLERWSWSAADVGDAARRYAETGDGLDDETDAAAALDAYGRDGDGGLSEQLRDPEQCSDAATLDELAIARICARYWLAVARKRNETVRRAAETLSARSDEDES
jgi:hypothetical protein